MVMRARWRGFELPTTIYAEKDTLTAGYGKFVAEPFERGFGITIGNSLRRVLLSSLEGAAATRVKIEGVLHEFSSLPGVVEDVTDIVLNVKQLLVKVRSDEPQKLVLDVKKKGIVRAGDFAAHSLVQVVNPDLHLAELSEDVRFKMEVWVQRGRGYVTAEENDSEDREIGVIPIDSVYSPVRRVRYRTENTRVGQLTDYDKLVLEVWTDGTVHPELALVEAAKILRKHLISFVGYGSLGHELPGETFEPELEAEEEDEEGAEASEAGSDKEPSRAAKPTVDLTRGVRSLDLGQRTVNALEGAGIESLVDLIQQSEDDLLKLRNFGRTSLKEVQTKLADLGLELSSAATAGA